MGLFSRLLGNDHERAAQYEGRESATQTAARKRREGHHRNLRANAAAGQAWEDADRQQDRRGGWYRTR